MKKEGKTAHYDGELRLEAYRFTGMAQPFPSHFHEYYVLGFVEGGKRFLSCQNQEYAIGRGDVLLFNPGDIHACIHADEALDYRGINITKDRMLDLTKEITGKPSLPRFSQTVLCDEDVACYVRRLHELILHRSLEFGKEEHLLLLLSLLIQRYGQPFEGPDLECQEEIKKACSFIEEHFTEPIHLDQICRHAGLSKSTLLRAFTKAKGLTPYCYLENIRIGAAKRLLEQGVPPVEAALQTGFSDQSHFTTYFNYFIGLTPGIYRKIFLKKQGEK